GPPAEAPRSAFARVSFFCLLGNRSPVCERLLQRRQGAMEHYVERGDGDAEFVGDLLARALLKHTEADGLGVAWVDPGERRGNAPAGVGQIALFGELDLTGARQIPLRGVDLPLQILRLVERLTAAGAE